MLTWCTHQPTQGLEVFLKNGRADAARGAPDNGGNTRMAEIGDSVLYLIEHLHEVPCC